MEIEGYICHGDHYILTPADDMDDTDREQLALVVTGAYPTIGGEWTGEEWILQKGQGFDTPPTDAEFYSELRYIARFNKHGE